MNAFEIISPGALVGVAFVFGLIVGSFLNVVIHRLPRGESLVSPRSRCPHCQRAISALDNIPVISYVVLRGRCRGCAAPISPRYPAVELFTACVFAGIALRYGADPMTPLWCVFAAALIAAGVIDIDHRIIPDEISLGGLVVAVVAVPAVQAFAGEPLGGAILRSLAGACLGGGLLWLVGFVHARVAVAMGREFEHWPGEGESLPKPSGLDYWIWFPGLGFGDVKLLAMIGAVIGPVGVLETILVSSLAGLAGGLIWAATIRSWSTPFGFGPAIAVGALLVLLIPHQSLFSG